MQVYVYSPVRAFLLFYFPAAGALTLAIEVSWSCTRLSGKHTKHKARRKTINGAMAGILPERS